MRVALVIEQVMCHPSHILHALVIALRHEFPRSVVFRAQNDHADLAERLSRQRADFDLVILLVRFTDLQPIPDAIASTGLPVVMIEHDAHFNYNPTHAICGQLSEFLAKSRIDLLVVTGRRSCELLRAEGQETIYLPKAAPASFLARSNQPAWPYCAFGSVRHAAYARRAALFDEITRPAYWTPPGRPTLHVLKFPFTDMADLLSRYSAAVICDLGLGEPMIKHFEVSALGLAPIRDDETVDELAALGYEDGDSMIVYRDGADLLDKLGYYRKHDTQLRRIQERARAVARHHTWELRAHSLRLAIEPRSGAPVVRPA